MSRKVRIAYLSHSLRSDWNNGNAHFLRGLLRELGHMGHAVTAYEPEEAWSIENLLQEPRGAESLSLFEKTFPDLRIVTYPAKSTGDLELWRASLADTDIVIVHEWNPPALSQALLALRRQLGYKLLFHDTHHRASSSPESIRALQIDSFDGVLAFGEALRSIYRARFGLRHVWTLHEAADVSTFHPRESGEKQQEVVWVGNWGDEERAAEIREYLLEPAARLSQQRFTIHGVRYPKHALEALRDAGVRFCGYLPNIAAPGAYASSTITVHVPRQQYSHAMAGIPTIRVFEALASGIPLVSAPWHDAEDLFREGDLLFVSDGNAMTRAVQHLLDCPDAAQEQAQRGLETVLSRHTCRHRAEELSNLCEELLR